MILSPLLEKQKEFGSPTASKMHSLQTVNVAIVLANFLDKEVLVSRLSQPARIEIAGAWVDIEEGLSCCRRVMPQILLVDPKCHAHAIEKAIGVVRQQHVPHLVILDDRVHPGRLATVLSLQQVSYVTRESGFASLLETILHVVDHDQRMFCPETQKRLKLTPEGWQFVDPADEPVITLLTTRELQIMRLLALGNSVRECAEKIHVSKSTVDNHKARLMKKLGVHKTVDLTRIAIREGLIDV